jgi:glycine/D-amino acid oxidase-like deaminating enzyme
VEREYIEALEGVTGAAGSPWLAGEAVGYPALEGERQADVLVVGAGITGALTARRLVAEGRRVILVDRRRLASGTSGHSTAKVTALHGVDWLGLLDVGEPEKIRLWAAANLAAVEEICAIALDLGVDCGLRRMPAFLVSADASADATFDQHTQALISAGLPVSSSQAPKPFGRPAAALGEQALFDPAAFVVGVITALGEGAEVFEATPVRALDFEDDGWRAHGDHGSVRAPVVIMADHFPVHDSGGFFTRMFPYAHYALEFSSREPIPDGMWIQAGGEELTLRPTLGAEGTWIAGGGRSRVASIADERQQYAGLADSTAALVGEIEVVRHWSAHDHETPDGLPYIGAAPFSDGLFMAAGYAGWGMTKSAVASSIIADAVAGRPNLLADLVSPSRTPQVSSAGLLTRENATVGRNFVGGHLTSRRSKSHDDSVAGGTCTHLGCETKWNTAEGTVDCPCHGSRYGRHGNVIYGPAVRDIEPNG